MAGPWFTVQESAEGWKTLDTIWISDGEKNFLGVVELKVELEEVPDDAQF